MTKTTTKKMSLSEKVRRMDLWLALEEELKEPFSKEDLADLALVGEYLKEKHANQPSVNQFVYRDLEGHPIKALDVVEDGDDIVLRENTQRGPVFWIRVGGMSIMWVRTDGRAVIDYGDTDDDWVFREYDAKGNVIETLRKGDKMKKTRHPAVSQAALLRKKKQLTR